MLSRLAIPLLCGACLLSGCHSDRVTMYSTAGKVVFADGQPVRTGTIELESVTFGTTAAGSIREDGTFVLGTYSPSDGAAAGKHRVIVVQMIVADGTVKHTKAHGRPVPVNFGRYDSSGLTAEILPRKKNDLVLTLPSKSGE